MEENRDFLKNVLFCRNSVRRLSSGQLHKKQRVHMNKTFTKELEPVEHTKEYKQLDQNQV